MLCSSVSSILSKVCVSAWLLCDESEVLNLMRRKLLQYDSRLQSIAAPAASSLASPHRQSFFSSLLRDRILHSFSPASALQTFGADATRSGALITHRRRRARPLLSLLSSGHLRNHFNVPPPPLFSSPLLVTVNADSVRPCAEFGSCT